MNAVEREKSKNFSEYHELAHRILGGIPKVCDHVVYYTIFDCWNGVLLLFVRIFCILHQPYYNFQVWPQLDTNVRNSTSLHDTDGNLVLLLPSG